MEIWLQVHCLVRCYDTANLYEFWFAHAKIQDSADA